MGARRRKSTVPQPRRSLAAPPTRWIPCASTGRAPKAASLAAGEAIADTGFGLQEPRLRRVGLELLAQVRHVDPHVVVVLHVRRPPDLAQQLPVRQDLAWMRQQGREQAELE